MVGASPSTSPSASPGRGARGLLALWALLAGGATLPAQTAATHTPTASLAAGRPAPAPEPGALARHRLREAGLDPSRATLGAPSRLPSAVDNSTLPAFPPLFDQGELESCTAVVSTYYQLTHAIGLRRGWDQARLSDENRFSPAWTYNLTNHGANIGVGLSRAYRALAEHGAVTLDALPYRGAEPTDGAALRNPEAPVLRDQARANRIARFGLVDAREPAHFLAELKRLLLEGHLLSGSTAIEGWNRTRVQAAPGGNSARHVGEFICTRIDEAAPVSHAITLVGYDDDIWVDLDGDGRAEPGEHGAFKLVNSWGTRDWNGGFRWLHYAAVARRPAEVAGEPARRGAFWGDRVFWLLPAGEGGPAGEAAPSLASATLFEDGPAGVVAPE